MNLQQFKDSLKNDAAPSDLSLVLQALWLAGKSDWHGSHDLLQDDDTADGSWVHAYLHREEGDIPNARYWYAKAGRTMPEGTLQEEWDAIAEALLAG